MGRPVQCHTYGYPSSLDCYCPLTDTKLYLWCFCLFPMGRGQFWHYFWFIPNFIRTCPMFMRQCDEFVIMGGPNGHFSSSPISLLADFLPQFFCCCTICVWHQTFSLIWISVWGTQIFCAIWDEFSNFCCCFYTFCPSKFQLNFVLRILNFCFPQFGPSTNFV